MIEHMQSIMDILSSPQGVCWKTITIRHGPFLDYLRKGEAVIRELREREDGSGWSDIIMWHLFRAQVAPVPWDEIWLSPLLVREVPQGIHGMEVFLDAAKRVVDSYQEHPSFSLAGCLSEQLTLLHVQQRRSFLAVVPRGHYRQDWLDFLAAFPCLRDQGQQRIGNQLILADKLHTYFKPTHYLILAGMVWERLAGSLHQALTAPRWENVLHVRMHGTIIHRSFPDYLTTLPWKKEVKPAGLFQSLSGDSHSAWTGLSRCQHEEIVSVGPELSAPPEAFPDTTLIPDQDILIYEKEWDDNDNIAHYSGLAFAVTTRSHRILYQPLYQDGRRGGIEFLCCQTQQLGRTSVVTPGMLILATARLRRRAGRPGGVNAALWKQVLWNVLKQKGKCRVARELRGQIQLRYLETALLRWAHKSLLDAPGRRSHFEALWAYLGLPEEEKAQAWKTIRLGRRKAQKRGQDWSTRRHRQIRTALAERLAKAGDVADLSLERGGQDLFRDDRVRVFLSEVADVAGGPVERRFSRCNIAYRMRQE